MSPKSLDLASLELFAGVPLIFRIAICEVGLTKSTHLDVAVKSCKQGSASALRGLLAEIKIMAYLGKHENILNLLVAHTDDMNKGRYEDNQFTKKIYDK